ncbi:PREDICTED: uncharacterized protein LOC105462029 [Wasmannia auropunctata]|uniref:uncharacterized protein LOC105462029 n=1 Tax=Wasmannia auropunctata TaxID=64793 RepID=UPI0005EFA411|nr:PREDICTED: uncharacterized protein LOC105462029 [Wasmannia auropunctata]
MAWKIFVIIFAFTLATYVAAEIPSYIHLCGRKDPNLDKCVTNSVENLRSYICRGIPELTVPALESFPVNTIVISDTYNAKLYFKDLKIMRLCDFVINFFHIDMDKLHIDVDLSFKHIYVNGTYDFDIRLLVPFVHKGPVSLNSDNVRATLGGDMKLITKNNKRYSYLSKITTKLDVKTVDVKFEEQDSSQLNEILNSFIGNNKRELIDKLAPPFEIEISKQLLLIANAIIKHFTFDELFPEQV